MPGPAGHPGPPPQHNNIHVFDPSANLAYQQQQAANRGMAEAQGQPMKPPQQGYYAGPEQPGLPGFGSSVHLDTAAMQNMQGVAAGLAMDYGQQMASRINSNVNRYVSVGLLRYYFQLNNAFVASKIKVLLFPYRHKAWSRAVSAGGNYAEPRHDINAPDLYLPAMAFVTHILLIAQHLAQQGRFTPEIFGLAASKGLGVVLLEVVLMKLAFYLFPVSSGAGAPFLDLAAYSGYKYVGTVVSMAVGSFTPVYVKYCVSAYTAVSMGFFLLKTLTEVRGAASLTPEVMKQNYCIFALAGLQIPFSWYLAW